MRTEREMLDLILDTARQDDRIRAVILNGSRANPNARRDPFQDFDIVFLVTDVASFKDDPAWVSRFGELMIMQLPDDMQDPPPGEVRGYTYLMQFQDGNRIDLNLCLTSRVSEAVADSLTVVLLDKDNLIPPLPPSSDHDYLPTPPTAKQFADCCNEFWWCCPYVAKGLWRGHITYARGVLETYVRPMLMKMLAWYVGVQTGFSINPGSFGKYLEPRLSPDLWARLLATYSDASYDQTWDSLYATADLFRHVAVPVAEHFGLEYPHADDARVTAHLQHVRTLPPDATSIY